VEHNYRNKILRIKLEPEVNYPLEFLSFSDLPVVSVCTAAVVNFAVLTVLCALFRRFRATYCLYIHPHLYGTHLN